jgi:hypothetical protein
MMFAKDANTTEEVVAISPWDIQVIVHGEAFPAKRFKEHLKAGSENCSTRSDIAGFIKVGEWLTDAEKVKLRKLMSFPDENPSYGISVSCECADDAQADMRMAACQHRL